MSESEESEPVREDLPERDWLLSMLVGAANEIPISFGVTLNVPGGLVSGIVVSGNEYLHGIASEMEQAGPLGESFGRVMRSIAVSQYPMTQMRSEAGADNVAEESEIDLTDPERRVAFIHLKDARIFNTDQPIPGDRGVWWRGKLSEVAGFSFGNLSTVEV